MTNRNDSAKKPSAAQWLDSRLPILSWMQHQRDYPAPRNLNYWWNFGSIAGVCLVVQIITGIVLAMHYTPHTSMAFDSVEHIMRNVNYGWLLRYVHSNGASMFFFVVYIHMLRGLYYGSYKAPREVLWWLGVIILLLMMATAFMGYVLPWGQMSFWGATVITNLFSAFPGVGEHIVSWLWGGFSVDNPTLGRFFSLHYLLPFVLFAVVFLHLWALHMHGSSNPLGIDTGGPQDKIPFHPYYTIKDFFGFGVFFLLFSYFVFFAPNYLGHPDNYTPANPMVTPSHIVPEWYFLPFYAILRAIPDKLAGVLAMFGSILVLFVLPWLDTCKVRSGAFRPLFKPFFALFVLVCIGLGYLGAMPAEGVYVFWARILTGYYFGYFLVILPLLGKYEKTLPLPKSIGQPVLKAALVLLLVSLALPARADSTETKSPKQIAWKFSGALGTVDRQSAQRGLQVYREVCSACHSLKRVAFRSLSGIGFPPAEIKALAAEYSVMDGPNDDGEMFERPGMQSDTFTSPFANEKAARAANGGAYPLDLSLIVKARPDGANYVYSLLTGYGDAPKNVHMAEGMNYNPYFPGGQIAMLAPLSEGRVTYADGTSATVNQMARDVVNFLQWAAEPEMEMRKGMGVKVMIFLLITTLLLYAAKRRIWRDLH